MKDEDTSERILIAAREVFSRKGYSGATTREISAAAEVAEITLFRHFETKNNLFCETVSKFIVKPMLNLKFSKIKEGSEDVIHKIIKERIYTLRKNKDLFICTIYESQFNDEIKNMLKSIFSKVFDELMDYMRNGSMNMGDKDIEHRSQVILSTIVGLIIFESLTGNEIYNNVYEIYFY